MRRPWCVVPYKHFAIEPVNAVLISGKTSMFRNKLVIAVSWSKHKGPKVFTKRRSSVEVGIPDIEAFFKFA